MIRVRIKGRPGKVEGFLIWGHAGFARRGQDIVCAGVSAVAIAALLGLKERLRDRADCRILPQGLVYCRIAEGLAGPKARDAQVILTTMIRGLASIRQAHRGYIDIVLR